MILLGLWVTDRPATAQTEQTTQNEHAESVEEIRVGTLEIGRRDKEVFSSRD